MAGPFPSGHKVLSTDLNPILLGWIDMLAWFGTTLAYVSADAPTFVFSVNADVTDVIEPGMRVKLTQTTDKFFIVTAVGAYAAGVTPITVYGGTDYTLANSAITAGSFSTHKKPYGFNASPAKWTESLVDTNQNAQATPTQNVWYNPASKSLSVPIGAWFVEWASELSAGTANQTIEATLSTANNSASDAEFIAETTTPVLGVTSAVGRRKAIIVASKTSYFLNARTRNAGVASITLGGAGGAPNIIRAVCAYL